MNYNYDWCIQGPAIWAASCLSFLLAIFLLIVNIRKLGLVRANFYGIAIPITSFLGLLAFQSKFLAIHVRYNPWQPWVNRLVAFARSYPCTFSKHLLPFYLDILIVLDCLNRFIIICHPEHIAKVMHWGLIIAVQVVSLLISSAFAFLSAKLEIEHIYSVTDWLVGDFTSTWEYNISIKIVANSLSPLFFTFFTIKICSTLNSAAAFLRRSQSTIEHAIKYERIIAFSRAICALFLLFPFLLENVQSGFIISDNIKRFHRREFADFGFTWQKEIYVQNFLDVILCLKSGSFATAYLWLKSKQD